MAPRPAVDDSAQKTRIIEAAETRFRIYGYRKTTMNEIADEAGMSAANLYRYFENKQNLAVACSTRCLQERVELLKAIADNQALLPTEKLEQFIFANLEHSYKMRDENPRINEMVEELTQSCADLVHFKIESERRYLTQLIEEGCRDGTFQVDDPGAAAITAQAAMLLFQTPLFLNMFPREFFEQEAHNLAHLLLNGLRRR
jgi:AcrR family transcriptional regulator